MACAGSLVLRRLPDAAGLVAAGCRVPVGAATALVGSTGVGGLGFWGFGSEIEAVT